MTTFRKGDTVGILYGVGLVVGVALVFAGVLAHQTMKVHASESKGTPCQAGSPQLCIPIRDADRERFKAIPAEFTAAQSQLQAAQNWQSALREEQETIRLRACLAAGLADVECGGFIGDKVGVNPRPADENKK